MRRARKGKRPCGCVEPPMAPKTRCSMCKAELGRGQQKKGHWVCQHDLEKLDGEDNIRVRLMDFICADGCNARQVQKKRIENASSEAFPIFSQEGTTQCSADTRRRPNFMVSYFVAEALLKVGYDCRSLQNNAVQDSVQGAQTSDKKQVCCLSSVYEHRWPFFCADLRGRPSSCTRYSSRFLVCCKERQK